MAQDVVAALRATINVENVVVVTDDPHAAAVFQADAEVVADEPRRGLSAAVEFGATFAQHRWPVTGVVVLAADLPAARPKDIASVLARCTRRAVVADRDGTGTVLLAAAPGLPLRAAYEGCSYAAHLRTGAEDLTPYAGEALRRDVDTLADLTAVTQLGVGIATATFLASAVHLEM